MTKMPRQRQIRGTLVFRPGITAPARLTLAFLLLSCGVAAQDFANWNTGSGNWGNANNWDCVIGGVSSHCIPGAGFVVTNIGGDITLDVDVTVASISGTAGSLTLNNRVLTATDILGIQITGGAVTASSSTINGFLLTNDLQLQTSTVNGNVEAFNANITNSTLRALTVANQLTAANSSIAANSNVTISQPSSITNTTIGGQFNIEFGAPLTVDGGSIINATQNLITSGSLTIQGGSTWNASFTPVSVGLTPGASTIDVSGAGSKLNLANTALELGEIANSTVTVEQTGTIAASGSGGNFLIGLGVVFATDSRMFVDSGGNASANNITVSGGLGGLSTGLLSISGSSSSVTAGGQLLVQLGGVVNAATQSSLTANSLRIQTGSLTVDSGASLNLGSGMDILVGSAGTGTLTLQGGGTADAAGELVLGTSSTSSGTLNIVDFGSKWDGTGNVSVGENGAGSLNVRNSGLLVTGTDGAGLSGSIGTQSSGSGTVTVQGGDWQAGGTLKIGAAGSGALQLSQAGTVESGAATIGTDAGSSGSVSVTGAGSQWVISGNLTVGSFGNGALGISNAGLVSNTNATIGDRAGSSGSVTVVGLGSLWQNSGILTVGGDGGASLVVDAGTVTAGGAGIGSNFAPVHVTVTNHGALSVLGDVSIGGGGATDLTIQNGGTFDSGTNATIGGTGGNTTVTVTDPGSAWTLHGTGNLDVGDKGSLLVMNGGTVTSSSITVSTGGLLNGEGGHIIGSLFNTGGTITPGDATGSMSITGNYTQSSGTLLLEIDGVNSTQFDHLGISGLADFTGGSIDLQFGNGFVPAAGESFDMLDAALGLSLSNVTFGASGLPSNLDFTVVVGANGLSFDIGSNGAPTPEPTTMLLLGGGILALAGSSKLGRNMAKR